MLSWTDKDIDRVTRATGLGRDEAASLLERYQGKPDLVLEKVFGVTRIYAEPVKVEDASPAGVTAFFRDAAAMLKQGLRAALGYVVPASLILAVGGLFASRML